MKESFLHYIWQYQLFDKNNLNSSMGEKIVIEKPGKYTPFSGPDFINSQIKIGDQLWFGNVEIHLKSSDWYAHHHEIDPSYDNVILHVVWEDDVSVYRKNNSPIPTIELSGKVPKYLLENYNQLFNNQQKWIPCENSISRIDNFTWEKTLEKIYFERLIQKTETIHTLLEETNNDWEAVLFVILAKNFGLKVNGEVFFKMAKVLDFNVLRKISIDEKNLEATFFGILNLLNKKSQNPYEKELFQIFEYLKHKYNLREITESAQFYRLHPPNFPNIRLSQLAQLFSKKPQLMQQVIHTKELSEFYKIFSISTAKYWQTHYTFDKEHKKMNKKTTPSFIDLLLINSIIPLKFAYKSYLGNTNNEDIIELLENIKNENNSIVTGFKKFNLEISNAMHSQALITLKRDYCDKKKCMECNIGLKILNQK